MTPRYYEDELRYLHEAGTAFAQVHPDQARYLNIDSLTDRDPYVERLFEGFAFLTGRIRERLDDELPQYTESLFRLLHPHFIKPVPALSILEFQPRPGMLQQTTRLERGTQVYSRAVGKESTACRFSTAYSVPLHPLHLAEARLEWPEATQSSVTLHCKLDRGVTYEKLDLQRLRLYCYAEPATASMMHLFFTRHVARVRVRAGDVERTHFGQQWVQPVGFAPDEGLLPYAPSSFTGYRLLQEYFCFRPKFWFIDLLGLDRFTPPEGTTEFQVQIHFDRAYPEVHAFQADNLRLYCTPIVNLFETDAEPIRVDHRVSEHRVVGDVRRPQTVAVYDVQQVMGIEETTGRRHAYNPFFSFTQQEQTQRFFVENTRVGPTGGRETLLSLGGFGKDIARLPVETLTLEVRCTNADLPREALQEHSIDQPAPGFANVATFHNLTRPSRMLPPPTEENQQFFWQLISHLALNRMSVATTESLTALLRLYDWTDAEANRRRMAGIRNVSWEPIESVHRGGVIRGIQVTLEIQDGHFADEGDLHLFGTVLSTFFSMYATINSFVQLTLISMPSGKEYQWQPQKGALPLA